MGDDEAGEVGYHKPYMIHPATENEDALCRVRLPSDLRFYGEEAALDQRSLKVWRQNDGL